MDKQIEILNNIKTWLAKEIKNQQPVIDGTEILTDGSEGIYEGRYECAKSLLDKINQWENIKRNNKS
jgi:hypothetical protein